MNICTPPTVAIPAPIFRNLYVDIKLMPPVSDFRYTTQARRSLIAWPEWRALRTETGHTLITFLFEDILCTIGLGCPRGQCPL